MRFARKFLVTFNLDIFFTLTFSHIIQGLEHIYDILIPLKKVNFILYSGSERVLDLGNFYFVYIYKVY